MNYVSQFTRMWNESSSSFPTGLESYSNSEKTQKEDGFEKFQSQLKAELKDQETKKGTPDNFYLIRLLSGFFKDTAGYPSNLIEVMFSEPMIASTHSFIQVAKKFDPAIGFEELFQAVRNVWIMNGLQFLMNRKVCLTPPIFAYSMLYPYTDNFLDNPEVAAGEKQDFGRRFEKRLRGFDVPVCHEQERKIFRMVELIEGYWDRYEFPEVYESLLGIHHAQQKSTDLITRGRELPLNDIFSICVEKGGMSVIADGYLVFGKLSEEEKEFFYYYGAYLQLLDDLQDVNSDLADSLMTAYSSLARNEKLDEWLCKTYSLGLSVLRCADRLQSARLPEFKALMKRSIDLFLIGAVFTNHQFFSEEFVCQFEKFSPVGFDFIRKKDKVMSPYQNKMFEQVLKRVIDGYAEKETPGQLFSPEFT